MHMIVNACKFLIACCHSVPAIVALFCENKNMPNYLSNLNGLVLHHLHRCITADMQFVNKYSCICEVPPNYLFQTTNNSIVRFLYFLNLFDSPNLGLAHDKYPITIIEALLCVTHCCS